MILDILKSESDMDKVMVAAKSTKNINNLVTRTKFVPMCNLMGYDVLWITSKYGAFINGDKVARDKFFDTMNEWGALILIVSLSCSTTVSLLKVSMCLDQLTAAS